MEVPKVLRLCDELNKMGIKYLIFTIDNKSLKSYGDDLSAKTLEDKADLVENLEQILANSKMLEDTKAGQDPKPVTSTKVKLLPNEDRQVKGTLQLRALCTQFLQIHGFSLKDWKKKYGVGPCPPGWPSPLNWSNFKGPGKHSVGMCEEIIHAMKVHQSQQGAVGGCQPQQVADHGLGDLGYDDLANLVDRAEVVLQLQEEGGEEVGEQVDEVA